MSSDWWRGDRVTNPPLVNLLAGENRRLSISLATMLGVGESTSLVGMTANVYNWRTRQIIIPSPITDPLTYDSGTKTVSLKIDASLLPVREHLSLVITCDVSSPAGSDRRAVYTILYLET